ncbi:hypothetical protein Tco_1067831 [Tanacetum coccineum]|uniref:Uncharacterized protein n=1 Tax=Tanacetum coccineum TaxID=301880 RepID=A0ABQ5HFA5_9ASTR
MNHQTSFVPQIAYQSPQVNTQPMTESPLVDSGFAIPIFSLRDDPIACLNKAMAFLTAVASSSVTSSGETRSNLFCTSKKLVIRISYSSRETMQCGQDKAMLVEAHEDGIILDEEQLTFLADPEVPNGQAIQTIIPNNAALQTQDLDTYDSNCDDISNPQAVLMGNISNYGFDVISEAQQDSMILSVIEQMSEQIINHVNYWEKANKEHSNETVTTELKRYKERVKTFEQRLNIDLSSHEKMIDSQMDDMIKEKLALKEQDPEAIKQNISHKPIGYEKLNKPSEDFGKCFTLQQELAAEQAFWFRISNPTIESSNKPPVKVEVPSELPKVSLVNASLKKLKFHLAQFDSVVKKRTTPDARTEVEWGFEHTKAVFNNEIIPFLKSLKDIFNVFDKDLLNEIMEVQTIFDQMEAVVQQSSVDKQFLEIAKKKLLLENDRLLQQIMSQDVLLTVINFMSLNGESVNMERKRNESCDKCFNLDAELLKSQNAHNDLLKSYST